MDHFNKHLAQDEAHVWSIPLDQPDHEAGALIRLLDPDELDRLKRLRCQLTSRRFIMAHAALRLLLSYYCGVPSARIRYAFGPHGKPELLAPLDINFNISHSGDLAVAAVSLHPVGIDLERIAHDIPFESIARRYFSSAEYEVLRSLPEHLRLQSFYACWTRKEAYAKATGAGFSFPSSFFDVSLAPGQPPELAHHRLDPDEPLRWRIHDLCLPPGFHGAVVIPAETATINQHRGTWGVLPLSAPYQ